MRKALAPLSACIVLFAVSTARAESIAWQVMAADTTVFNDNNTLKSSAFMYHGLSPTGSSTLGASPTLIYSHSVTVSSSALPNAPDSFSATAFSMPVTVVDFKSVGIAGAISTGTVNLPETISTTNVSKFGALPPTYGNGSAQITLGAPGDWRLYTLTVVPGTAPGPIGTIAGSMFLEFSVAPGSAPAPSATPEPTSLVLAGLALAALLMARRQRRKAQERRSPAYPGCDR